jgi:hypothetical protein
MKNVEQLKKVALIGIIAVCALWVFGEVKHIISVAKFSK